MLLVIKQLLWVVHKANITLHYRTLHMFQSANKVQTIRTFLLFYDNRYNCAFTATIQWAMVLQKEKKTTSHHNLDYRTPENQISDECERSFLGLFYQQRLSDLIAVLLHLKTFFPVWWRWPLLLWGHCQHAHRHIHRADKHLRRLLLNGVESLFPLILM